MRLKKKKFMLCGILCGACLLVSGMFHTAQATDIHVNTLKDVSQVIVAETKNASSSYAIISAYEETSDGVWTLRRQTTSGRVGSNGIVPILTRKQSTSTTPEGVLKLLSAYGTASDPGSLFPYHHITDRMYWNLNSGTETYNQLVYSDPGGNREHLIQYKTYTYMFTTDYNIEQIAGKGGAIFLHCNGSGATSGCVSMPEADMKWCMQWLDPSQNPSLIVTTTADKSSYFVPETPQITSIAQTDAGICIAWGKSDGAARYEIQRASDYDGTYQTVAILGSDAVTWTDGAGSRDSVYRVVAVNEIDGQDGYSAVSQSLSAQMPFTDVSHSAYYFDAVEWAVENHITVGTSATTFSPNSTCTRSQIMQFIWRGNGEPAPDNGQNPFSDVKMNAWYANAVMWGVQNGITAGTSATTFSPDLSCTRAQAITLLWRSAGQPQASEDAAVFQDVKPSDYYYDAVRWAAEQGITVGTGNQNFSPNNTCTRAQIITFMQRMFG